VNGTDRDYFDTKLSQIDRKLQNVHDDVLIIKTERKADAKYQKIIAGFIAFAISAIIGIFGR